MNIILHRLSLVVMFYAFLVVSTTAQTTIINPAGDGGFETGATFAANGWTEVNGTQTNKWFTGTSATGFTGARCAHIGTASTNNTYNIGITSVVHFYRNITIPAGQPNVALSFSWKGYGEGSFDYLRVYIVGTGITPVAGIMLGAGQIGGDFNLTSAWQTATLALPCNLAGTTQRLVFTWRNDNSVGTNPPACIDNISLISSGSSACAPYLGTGVTNVASLPYGSGAGTTCGQANDLTAANTAWCGSNLYLTGEDRVWVFTPTATGQVTINLNAPSASWTGLMLYLDCPVTSACGTGSATCIAYEQSPTGSKSLCATVTAGNTYYLVLDSYAFPTCNNYNNLTISAVATGNNGAICSNAVNIPSFPYSALNQTTACMGNDYTGVTAGICNGGFAYGEDMVYQFTVASATCIGISISGASNNDVGFAVYQGCPGSGGVCIGGSAGATAGSISSSVTLPGAGTYYLIIDTRNPSNNVGYDLSITSFGAGAPNDLPYLAQPLPFNIPIGGNNNCSGNADEPVAQPGCFQPAGNNPMNTVWYSFVAPASGSVKIRTLLGTLTNTQIAVYGPVVGTIASGNGASLVLLDCNQDLPPCGFNSYPTSQLSLTGLVPGLRYYISVDGYGNQTGSFSIFIMDSGPGGTLPFPPTPGQDCALAFPVCRTNISVSDPGPQAVGSYCEFSSGVNCLASGERGSYWYRIQIVANGFLEFDIIPNDWPGAPSTMGTDYDFAVWRTKTAGVAGPANCNNLSFVPPVACNYSFLGVTGCYSATAFTSPAAYPGFGAAYQPRITVAAGDEYLLNVSNFTNSTSGFVLNFSAGSPIATVPAAGGTLVWTGTLNTDWYNPENWGGCAVPECIYNVSISSVPINQPSISGLTAVCGSLDISTGASLTLQSNSQLKVCNNFVNNGTLNALTNSTILMQSDAVLQNQSMTGSMTGANKIWNLTINKPSTAGGNTVTLNNDLDNFGNFTIGTSATYAGGIFNASGRYHKVAGHFIVYYAAAPYGVYSAAGATLEFNGTVAQNYFNRGTLGNVVMNHTGAGVPLGNSGATDWMTIGGGLTLTQGRIMTGTNRVSVINSLPAAISTGNSSSFVEGYLKRAFAPTGGIYDFPVGTALRGYQRINFNFGTSNDRTDAMLSFNNSSPVTPTPLLGPECIIATYDQTPLNHGYWASVATPSTGISSYSVTAYNASYTNPQIGYTVMNKHGAAPWGLEGFCVPASPITAVQRTGVSIMGTASNFAIAQALTPLPVEMLYLNAHAVSDYIQVNWATASEINNKGFEIYRADNPPDFKRIGWAEGKGNSTSLNEYEFNDYDVISNKLYYYRLKQIDFDGQSSLSDMVMARISGLGFTFSALPNPYSDYSNLLLQLSTEADVTIEVYSSLGQLVATPENNKLTPGTYTYEFGSGKSGFAKGVFTVKVKVGEEVTYLRLLELE